MSVKQPTPTLRTSTTETPNNTGRGRGTGRCGRVGRSGHGDNCRQQKSNNLLTQIEILKERFHLLG